MTGDLAQPATVDAALDGVSAVVLVSPAIVAEEMNVIDGAPRAGVQHIIKITSKSSLDSPIPRRRDQAVIENGLIASGLGHTLLRNNAYMQNFLMLAAQIKDTSKFSSAAGDGHIGIVDTRDVAPSPPASPLHPPPTTNRPIGGPVRNRCPTAKPPAY